MGGGSDRRLITPASGGRHLFAHRRRRWAGVLIWGSVVVGAVCLIGATASGREALDSFASSCAAVAAVGAGCGLLFPKSFANLIRFASAVFLFGSHIALWPDARKARRRASRRSTIRLTPPGLRSVREGNAGA